MLNPFRFLENLLYITRDAFWTYPDILFSAENSVYSFVKNIYNLGVPYSHFFLAFVSLTTATAGIFQLNTMDSLFVEENKLIEGVVMGVDTQGNPQKISKVNPLVASNIQLEKDLIELLYEPLVKTEYQKDADGIWQAVVDEILAEEVIQINEGSDYQFRLRKDVLWHDGVAFDADDVVATLDLYSKINVSNAYVQTIKQLQWEKIDRYNVRICTRAIDDQTSTCSEKENNPIFSNFLELISVKIIPAHLMNDINPFDINATNSTLFASPVGTGNFKFLGVNSSKVSLEANLDYYDKNSIPKINSIDFVFFKDLESAINALKAGEIHSLASISVEYLTDLKKYNNITVNYSPVLDKQYWGLYFNLRKTPEGAAIGSEYLQDVRVRKAVSNAINRVELIQNAFLGVGEEAFGPIPAKSSFFNPQAGWYNYNVESSNKLLDEAGWTLKPGAKFRTNEQGEILKFNLYFVNSYDRKNAANVIKQNLERVGIEAIINREDQPGQNDNLNAKDGWTLDELNNQILTPRLFDVILYGMDTFIDPDRYELFHSSQSNHPGLNIASYVGTVETVRPKEAGDQTDKSTVRVSKVDRWLDQARAFKPIKDKEDRKKYYDELQSLIAEDAPVAFLYHPQFLYFTNRQVKNVDLTYVSSVEDRFRNVSVWEID